MCCAWYSCYIFNTCATKTLDRSKVRNIKSRLCTDLFVDPDDLDLLQQHRLLFRNLLLIDKSASKCAYKSHSEKQS